MKKLLITFFLVITATLLHSQQIYLRGYVVDSHNKGLSYVNIAHRGTSQGTTTNENGYYELAIISSKYDTIDFWALGYKNIYRVLPAKSEKSLNINIILEQDTSVLSTVDVVNFNRTKGVMTAIDTKVLKLTPDAMGGIESLVKMQLGVSSTNELSSQYSVRGGNFDENSVYVNDIEIYRPLLTRASQQEGLSFINPDLVEKVEFSAGGFPAKYGDKMSSVLDITYKKPKQFEGNITAGFMGISAYVGFANKKLSMTHGIRYKTNQYLLSDKFRTKDGKVILKGLDTKGNFNNHFIDYQTLISYDISKKISLSFLGNISDNRYNFIPKSRTVVFGTYFTQREFNVLFEGSEQDRFTTYFGAFTLDYKPKEWITLKLTASAFNSNETETYDLIGAYSIADVKMELGNKKTELLGVGSFHEHARNRLSATVLNIAHSGKSKLWKTTVEWGLSANREIIFDKIREYESRDSAQYSLPHDGQNVKVIYSLTSNNSTFSTRLQAYLQQTYKMMLLKASWTFNVGVRASYWDFNKKMILSPRINITCNPQWKHNFSFRMAAGLYYQSPFYKEIRQIVTDEDNNSYVLLNRNIQAQRSGHLLFGMDYYFRIWKRPFKFTTEIYYKPSDRVIPYSVENVRIRYAGENQAVAYTAGFDIKLFGEFVPGVDSWIAFSYMNSRENIVRIGDDLSGDHYKVFTNKGSYLGEVYPSYIPRPNEQRYSFSIFFQDYIPNHPEYKINLKFVWADGLPFGPPRTERYKAVFRSRAYRRVDIGASREFILGRDKLLSKQKVVKSLGFHLDLLNLFNIKNESSYYWVSDISGYQWAVPNYLTNFMVNFRISVGF